MDLTLVIVFIKDIESFILFLFTLRLVWVLIRVVLIPKLSKETGLTGMELVDASVKITNLDHSKKNKS